MKDNINNSRIGLGRLFLVTSLFLTVAFSNLALTGCFIPGLGLLPEADDPPEPTDPEGIEETYYGKFLIYQVANGEIADLDGGGVNYYVGDEVYYPSNDPDDKDYYNFTHNGDEPSLTLKYKSGSSSGAKVSSNRPEAMVANGSLKFWYTDGRGLNSAPVGIYDGLACGEDNAGETRATAIVLDTLPETENYIIEGMVNDPYDIDYWRFRVFNPGTIIAASVRFTTWRTTLIARNQNLHRFRLSIEDEDGNELTASTRGFDNYLYLDPFVYQVLDEGTYYIRVETLTPNDCISAAENQYYLFFEAPLTNPTDNYIARAAIQPARSGNSKLNGGKVFEPEDFDTEIEDLWPDCDGVPGSGDEGDHGVFEMCNSQIYGAGDGNIQYQEADVKSAINDGEFFIGTKTNVPSKFQSEVSVVKSPDKDSLLMFIDYGMEIYMIESEDGQEGLIWDLSGITEQRTAVSPLNRRAGLLGTEEIDFARDAPVVSSGRWGFCETLPGPGDEAAFPEMMYYGQKSDGATVQVMDGATLLGVRTTTPSAYPGLPAVTFGSNQWLESSALVDVEEGRTIYAGADGIINTYFAPKYQAYDRIPRVLYYDGDLNRYQVWPHPLMADDQYFNSVEFYGPANPDNPMLHDLVAGATVRALQPLGGSNQSGFLFGDDRWNEASFLVDGESLYPTKYLREQNCAFLEMGENFDKCALGVPIDPRTGEEPVSIEAGGDGKLQTVDNVLKKWKGDDELCLGRPADGGTVAAICPGNDGKFGWDDIYLNIAGDDAITRCIDPQHSPSSYPYPPLWTPFLAPILGSMPDFPEREVVCIGAGDNGILDTLVDVAEGYTVMWSYTIMDIQNFEYVLGGDHRCETMDGNSAICPGIEITIDMRSVVPPVINMPVVKRSNRIMTVWPMYVNSPSQMDLEWAVPPGGYEPLIRAFPAKVDYYSRYDDEFCFTGQGIGICPGENGYFQSYTINHRMEVDRGEDLFNMWEQYGDVIEQPCYTMMAEEVQDDLNGEVWVEYVVYKDYGVRFDDKIKWSADEGFHVTTGRNGINQSCVGAGDDQIIGFNKGSTDPNNKSRGWPIIDSGVDGTLQTYALADEIRRYGDGVVKINAGADGVVNSYALGDDILNSWIGTGKPDYPCVVSGEDGRANTIALYNDSQLYDPGDLADLDDGEFTGFDAYQTFGSDAIVRGNNIYLYYTGFGWETIPDPFRESKGALAGLGECHRVGLDGFWGDKEIKYKVDDEQNAIREETSIYYREPMLSYEDFANAVDNDNGVMLAPRIGLATADIHCLRNNETDPMAWRNCWNYRSKPVLDVGQQCAGNFDFAIDLGDLGDLISVSLKPETNYDGAYSPEIKTTTSPDGDGTMYLMFFTGLMDTEKKGIDESYSADVNVGVARSLDGVNWENLRGDIPPLVWPTAVDLGILLSSGDAWAYAHPTVVDAGLDDYNYPVYGMFFNQYKKMEQSAPNTYYDMRKLDHIGYALRKGQSYLMCQMGKDFSLGKSDSMKAFVQIAIFALPLILILAFRVAAKKQKA